VGGEQGLSGLLEVLLGGGKETVDPGKPGLLAMVGVEDDGDAVEGGDLTDVLGGGDGTGDGGNVVGVVEGLAGDELSATLGEGDHDGTAVLGGGLHAGVDGVGSNDIDSGDGVALLLGGIEKVDEGITGHDTGLDGGGKLGEGLGIGGGSLEAGGGTEGLLGRGEGGGGANEEPRWPNPVSFAITKGITVVFFSWAY